MAKAKVIVSENDCKGCGLCVSVCPKKVLALSKKKINSKGYSPACVELPDDCIGCANCAIMCPDSAITIEKRED